MKRFKSLAICWTLALAGACWAFPAKGQSVGGPVMVREVPSKPIWLKAEVVHFDLNSIIVREEANERTLHTFTYTPSLQAQVQKLLSKGGYQYGDKVKIRYLSGKTVALAIRGKPSKAL